MIGLGVSEAKLYAAVGGELPVRVPKVWHASYDDADSSFIMVMEDLDAAGCRFATAEDDDVLAHRRVAHGRARRAPRRLLGPGSAVARHTRPEPGGQSRGPGAHGDGRVDRPDGASTSSLIELPPEFRRLGEIYIAHNRDIGSLWNEGERTLIHGDDHIGNLFVDGGRTGFYDWAVASLLPRDARRRLLPLQLAAHRCAPRRARRADRPLPEPGWRPAASTSATTLAMEQYRLFSIYSWIAATTTAAMGSKWQPADVGCRATERTTQAIVDLDVLGLLADRGVG